MNTHGVENLKYLRNYVWKDRWVLVHQTPQGMIVGNYSDDFLLMRKYRDNGKRRETGKPCLWNLTPFPNFKPHSPSPKFPSLRRSPLPW